MNPDWIFRIFELGQQLLCVEINRKCFQMLADTFQWLFELKFFSDWPLLRNEMGRNQSYQQFYNYHLLDPKMMAHANINFDLTCFIFTISCRFIRSIRWRLFLWFVNNII